MKRLIKNTQKQIGTLYHYTDIDKLYSILKNDELGRWSGNYVSFTRNRSFQQGERNISSDLQCRLEVDGNSLSNSYKIEPYDFFGDGVRPNDKYYKQPELYEAEERVKQQIKPITPYITAITIYPANIKFSKINLYIYNRMDMDDKVKWFGDDYAKQPFKNADDLIQLLQTLYSGPINVG
jgi:hypothetical protein